MNSTRNSEIISSLSEIADRDIDEVHVQIVVDESKRDELIEFARKNDIEVHIDEAFDQKLSVAVYIPV